MKSLWHRWVYVRVRWNSSASNNCWWMYWPSIDISNVGGESDEHRVFILLKSVSQLYISGIHWESTWNWHVNIRHKCTHVYSMPSLRPVTQNVTLASGVYPPPLKLKQRGKKYIFQFSRCESFYVVIQMSLVFCVNRCPYPASFISISWLGFSMQLAVPLPHRY